MAERDPETKLERTGEELEEQIGRLEKHITEAQGKAADRRQDAAPVGEPTGEDEPGAAAEDGPD